MKILITGNQGFIGSHLTERLKEVLEIKYIGYDLVDGYDIRNKMQLDKAFEKGQFDIVIHLAAWAGVRRSEDYPEEYSSTNIIGTKNIIDMCENYGCSLIFFSSSSVLGGVEIGRKEGLHENDPYDSKSFYAMTKIAGECLVKASHTPSVIIRPFTVYGENGRPDMVIYKWINQYKSGKPISFFGKGDTERGYTYVKDLIEALLVVIDKLSKCNYDGVYHIGGREIITLDELYKIFLEVTQKITGRLVIKEEFKIPKGDVNRSFADITKAKMELGYDPKLRFKNIIKKILKKEL